MAFSPNVERWRGLVEQEIRAGGYPFPPEMILSIINFESGGKAGAVNPKSKASGLMQVMEVVVKDYNKAHKTAITMSDLRRDTLESAREQIKIGLWVLGAFWRGAYNYIKAREETVPIDDLVKIGDMFYAAGPGAIRSLFDKLPRVIFDLFAQRYPEHKAKTHALNVYGLAQENNAQWNLAAVDKWVSGATGGVLKTAEQGFLLALLLIAVVWFFFFKDKSPKTD